MDCIFGLKHFPDTRQEEQVPSSLSHAMRQYPQDDKHPIQNSGSMPCPQDMLHLIFACLLHTNGEGEACHLACFAPVSPGSSGLGGRAATLVSSYPYLPRTSPSAGGALELKKKNLDSPRPASHALSPTPHATHQSLSLKNSAPCCWFQTT